MEEGAKKPGIKMKELIISPNSYFSIKNPVFFSISTEVLAEILNVLLSCLYIGFSIWWALPPEVSLSQLLTTPTGFEIMEGLRKTVEVLISALEEGEAAERAKNEETREALSELPESPSARPKMEAVLTGSITLAFSLTSSRFW